MQEERETLGAPTEDEVRRRSNNHKIDRMGVESTFKLLLEFSIPAVVGVLVQMLYNVIDAVYVGHVRSVRTVLPPPRWRIL